MPARVGGPPTRPPRPAPPPSPPRHPSRPATTSQGAPCGRRRTACGRQPFCWPTGQPSPGGWPRGAILG